MTDIDDFSPSFQDIITDSSTIRQVERKLGRHLTRRQAKVVAEYYQALKEEEQEEQEKEEEEDIHVSYFRRQIPVKVRRGGKIVTIMKTILVKVYRDLTGRFVRKPSPQRSR